MTHELTLDDLVQAPEDARAKDSDGDVWVKKDEKWTYHGAGPLYSNWSSEKLAWRYTTYPVSGFSTEQDVTVEGVWIVWDSSSKAAINGLFPADGEVHALRMVNREGYGYAEFTPFGEVN